VKRKLKPEMRVKCRKPDGSWHDGHIVSVQWRKNGSRVVVEACRGEAGCGRAGRIYCAEGDVILNDDDYYDQLAECLRSRVTG